MTKFKNLLLIIFLSLSIFAEKNENVTIKISWIPDVHTTWPPDMARLAVFHEFLNKYSNINVEISSTLKLEGDAAEGNEYLAIAGGLAPDVFYLWYLCLHQDQF